MKQTILIAIIDIEKLGEKKLVGIEKEGVNLVVTQKEGEISVLDGICPHQGAFLSEGHIQRDQIICPAHQWKFNCKSGKKEGSKQECLKKFATIIKDGKICISKVELQQWKENKLLTKKKDTDKLNVKTISSLSGPRRYPLIGNTLAMFFNANKIPQLFEKWELKYGKVYKVRLYGNDTIVISDPVMAKKIFKERPHTFRNIKEAEDITEEMGLNGISTADGQLWKEYRGFVTKSFTNKDVQFFFPKLEKICANLRTIWENDLKKGKINFDVRQDLKKFTVDVISSMTFGEEINTLEHKDKEIHHYLDFIFNMIGYRLTSLFPYWKYIKLPKDYKLEKSIKEVKIFLNSYIEKARKKILLEEHKEAPSNFLETLLSSKNQNGDYLKNEEIYANLVSILIGGEDTTANTISWAMYYLMEFPELQKNVRQEVDKVLGEESFLNSIEQLHQLPYLDSFLKEVMRLKPIIPIVALSAKKDTVVNDLMISKGTVLHVFTSFRNNETNFEKSKEFDPNRWNTNVESKHSSLEAFMPFGSGARSCPFRTLALIEVKTVISMICRNFIISKPEQNKAVEEVYLATMNPKNLLVNFEKRNQ